MHGAPQARIDPARMPRVMLNCLFAQQFTPKHTRRSGHKCEAREKVVASAVHLSPSFS
jgi:hypothetical protein